MSSSIDDYETIKNGHAISNRRNLTFIVMTYFNIDISYTKYTINVLFNHTSPMFKYFWKNVMNINIFLQFRISLVG